MRLLRPSPECLELRPALSSRLTRGLLLTLGALLVLMMVWGLIAGNRRWGLGEGAVAVGLTVLIATVLGGVGLYELTLTLRFDRAAGRFCCCWLLGRRYSYPLSAALAVQRAYGGCRVRHGKRTRYEADGYDGRYGAAGRHSYQVNLVLDDDRWPRFLLTHNADLAWAEEASQQLAHFLGVPLLDQLPPRHGRRTEAPKGG
jgi:hypothetical protein